MSLRPMSEFDPLRDVMVHDAINDFMFIWEPSDLPSFLRHKTERPDGTVEWDGLILDGWCEVGEHTVSPPFGP